MVGFIIRSHERGGGELSRGSKTYLTVTNMPVCKLPVNKGLFFVSVLERVKIKYDAYEAP